MLLSSPRFRRGDLDVWATRAKVDPLRAQLRGFAKREQDALADMLAFARAGACYVGVSWGKDSMVVAHLAWRLQAEHGVRLPLAWVRREPVDNPDCEAVRDAFAARFDVPHHEFRIDCEHDPAHPECWWVAGDTRRTPDARPKQQGFARVAARFGDRYISGVRAAESGARVKRMAVHGVSTARTCAPIGWWPTADVYAYLDRYDLPIHPSYAMSLGGTYDRDRVRVGSIGSHHGVGHGRAAWELAYYPEIARLVAR